MTAYSRARLAALVAAERFDLAEANLLMAVEAHPGLDVDAQLGRVDVLADDARRRGGDVDAVVAALREAGLAGDRDDYDDPLNSFLHTVLDRRRGLPIALSALTVAVAERLGLRVAGVGMPGHFIVADRSGPAPRYLDPFAGWAELSEEDCAALVRDTSGLPFHPELLAPTAPREVLLRMLANLRGSYLRRQALADVLWTAELGLLVTPGAEPLERELPVLLAAVGRYDDAERAATAYLAERADSPHRAAVEAQLAAVRDLKRRMN